MFRRSLLALTCSLLAPFFSSADAATLFGTVLRADGSGHPGAIVEVSELPDLYTTQSSLLTGSFPPSIVAHTTTDANGRFHLTTLGTGVWQVHARAAGFVEMLYPIVATANDVELEPVVLRPAKEARFTITDSKGRPLEGIGLSASSADPEIWQVEPATPWRTALRMGWSNRKGIITVQRARGERLNVRLRRPGHSQAQKLSKVRQGAIVFDTEPGPTHRVAITDFAGLPTPAVLATADEIWPIGLTSESGEVIFEGPLEGPFKLYALSKEGGVRAFTLDPAEGGRAEAKMPPLVDVSGRVADRQGNPIAAAMVWPGHAPGASVTSNSEGRFRIRVPARARARLQAHAPGFLPRAEIYPARPDRPVEVEIVLDTALTLAGRVVDDHDRPVAGAHLSANAETTDPEPDAVRFGVSDALALSDSEGRFELIGLKPDESYEIVARRDGYTRSSLANVVALQEGAPELLHVVLRQGRIAHGSITDLEDRPLSGIEVRLTEAEHADDEPALSNELGHFELRLPPSTAIDIEARGRDHAPLVVRGIQIPAGDLPVDLGTLILVPGATLFGTVVDANQQPVANAVIEHLDTSDPRETEEPQSATTDEQGRFALRGIEPESTVDLRISASGFLPTEQRRIPVPSKEDLVVRLAPAARVSGRVVDTRDRPIEGASLSVERSANHDLAAPSTSSDEDGRFHLEGVVPGTVVVEARAHGYQPVAAQRLELAGGEHYSDLHFQLIEGAVLTGQVTTSDLEPISDVRLRSGQATALTDKNGEYRLTGLPSETLVVELRHPGYDSLTAEIEPIDETATADFVLSGGHVVSGSVNDGNGLPLAGARLHLQPEIESSRPSATTTSDVEGRFEFATVANGSYAVRAMRRGFVETEPPTVEVTDSSVDDIAVLMQAGTVVEGQILGLEFEDLARVEVMATTVGADARRAEIDYEGFYRIEDLGPADWTLEASLPGGARQARARLTIEPGDSRLEKDLEFGRGITLTGVVLARGEPVPETQVTARAISTSRARDVVTDYEGRFQIEDLTAGDYHLALAEHSRGLIHNRNLRLDRDQDLVIEFDSATLSGIVVDLTGGQSIDNAMVVLRQEIEGGRPGSSFAGRSDAEGRFQFPSLAAGHYRLEAMREGYEPSEQQLDLGPGVDISGLEVPLLPAGGLEVAVALESGEHPQFVTLAGANERGRRFAETRQTDGAGFAHFSTLPAGDWRMFVGASGGATIETKVLVPNEPLALVLPTAGRLRIRVPELVESDSVATLTIARHDGRLLQHLELGGDLTHSWPVVGGQAVVEGIPAGAWLLQITDSSGRSWAASATTTGGPDVEIRID